MDINDTISKYDYMIQFIYIDLLFYFYDLISHPKKINVQQIHHDFQTKQFVYFLNNIFDKFFTSIF